MDQVLSLIFSSEPFTVPSTLEYLFVIVGVFTGALFACDRKLDIVGTVVLGLVTGYGGGIIRDVLLQSHGVYFLEHPSLIVVSTVLCLLVFCFRGVFKHLKASITFFDALSVAFFAVAGGAKAISCGYGFVISSILASITAVGGGALRDVCVGETPTIFKAGNYYAVAALVSSVVYVGMIQLGLSRLVATLACVIVMLLLRYLSLYRNWRTHVDTDFSSKLTHSAKRFSDYLMTHSVYNAQEFTEVYEPQAIPHNSSDTDKPENKEL